MSEKTAEADGRGPGARLAGARENAGLTIFEVAERLHLDVGSLRALEADRLEIFGAAVFVRGHLRRYAELLGLPTAEIDAAYAACAHAPDTMPNLRRLATPLAETRTSVAPLQARTAVVGAIVLVLIALVWWAVRTPLAHRSASRARAASTEAPPASVAAPPKPSVLPPASAAAPVEASVPATPTSGAPPLPSAPSSAVPASSGPPTPASASPAGTQVRLGLKFSQDSWAEIYDARGAKLIYELATAGSERHLSGVAPLRILLGNPEGVTLELDGRNVALGQSGRSAPLRFALDGGGRVVEVPAANPSP
jgi:cytoskeleton protein RodZ